LSDLIARLAIHVPCSASSVAAESLGRLGNDWFAVPISIIMDGPGLAGHILSTRHLILLDDII